MRSCHTTRRIPEHPNQLRALYTQKYPKWWLQSFLAGPAWLRVQQLFSNVQLLCDACMRCLTVHPVLLF